MSFQPIASSLLTGSITFGVSLVCVWVEVGEVFDVILTDCALSMGRKYYMHMYAEDTTVRNDGAIAIVEVVLLSLMAVDSVSFVFSASSFCPLVSSWNPWTYARRHFST